MESIKKINEINAIFPNGLSRLEVGQYHAPLVFLAMGVVKALEHTADVCISFAVAFLVNAAEADLGRCFESWIRQCFR